LHWADELSLRTLLFGFRRLAADRVMAVLVTRGEEVHRLSEGLRRLVRDRGDTVHLTGLGVEQLQELAESMGVDTLSAAAASGLRQHTEGSPLHARALLAELPADAWTRPDLALPAPRSFSRLILLRRARCLDETRRLVDAASILGMHCSLAVAAHLADVR